MKTGFAKAPTEPWRGPQILCYWFDRSNCKTEKVIPPINYYVPPIRLTTCSVHIHNESTHLSMWCVQCWWIRTAYVSCICFFVALTEQLLKDGWTMLAVARMVRMKMTLAQAHPLDLISSAWLIKILTTRLKELKSRCKIKWKGLKRRSYSKR